MKSVFSTFLLVGLCVSALAGDGGELSAQWIGTNDICWDWRSPARPAPTFRKVFSLDNSEKDLKLAICGLGYFECRLDGRPITDALLVPGETQYDVRWRYRVFTIPALEAGRHVLTITCGDGLYRPTTPDVWHFDKAVWADYPKAACELRTAAGATVLKTDPSWQWRPSPTVFSSLRGGEVYDARLVFDDNVERGWERVAIVSAPGGIGEEEKFPPCRVKNVYAMTNRVGTLVWESPIVLTGNVRIRVKGARGAKVTIVTAEQLSDDFKHVDQRPMDLFSDVGSKEKTFQRDAYILAGSGEEVWSPRFTYHGFRYAEIITAGDVQVLAADALEIYNDFPRIGRVSSAPAPVLRVLSACENSILGNFHNIPTDCPQREKNGWTSECRVMCEAALYSFDVGSAYAAYADVIGDTQRPSGQISGIAPCNGWGYNWGSGPGWDTALMEVPDAVYLFTGDRTVIERLYPKVVRYLDYIETMLDADGVPAKGLGDWCNGTRGEHERLVRAAFRVRNLRYGEHFARLLGDDKNAARFARMREGAVATFRRLFCDKDGLSAEAKSVPHALMLDIDLVEPSRRAACAQRLAEVVKKEGAVANFGVIGSRCVMRMLFELGYADLGWKIMTQPKCPGYVFLTETLGMTTLPERWDPHLNPKRHGTSLNHGSFADYLAVAYRYLGGIRHSYERPGRDFVEIRPYFPEALDSFACEHEGFRVSWRREGRAVRVKVFVPRGKSACYIFQDGTRRHLPSGDWSLDS